MEIVGKLNPIDDVMFSKMAEEKAFCEEILCVILEDDELVVLESSAQWPGTNLKARSVILDTRCVLGDGTLVNVEVQKAKKDDYQRRARYNDAVLITNYTEKGKFFKDVPDVIVVFITLLDIFKSGYPMYHVDRTIRETGEVVYNGFSEIYVNSRIKNGSKVSELMRVFTEDNTYNPAFPVTSAIKKRYKETEGGRVGMGEISQMLYDRGRLEGLTEGRAEGRSEGERSILIKLLDKGLITPAAAAEGIGIDEAELMKRLAQAGN